MADIRVEKKGSSMWPWIFAIIGALLLIWILFALFNNDREPLGVAPAMENDQLTEVPMPGDMEVIPPGDTMGMAGTEEGGAGTGMGGTAGLPQPVQEFSRFVQERRLEQAMGLEHQVTSEGIMELTEALGAVAENRNASDEMFQATTDSMENAADQLQEETMASNHANLTRASLLNAAQLMERMGSQAGMETGGAIQEFRQTAESLDPQQPLLDQKDAISNAFNQADQALQELSRAGATTEPTGAEG